MNMSLNASPFAGLIPQIATNLSETALADLVPNRYATAALAPLVSSFVCFVLTGATQQNPSNEKEAS